LSIELRVNSTSKRLHIDVCKDTEGLQSVDLLQETCVCTESINSTEIKIIQLLKCHCSNKHPNPPAQTAETRPTYESIGSPTQITMSAPRNRSIWSAVTEASLLLSISHGQHCTQRMRQAAGCSMSNSPTTRRPRRATELRDVEAPIFSRQSALRLR
jgi:hypothetical protein